MACLPLFRLRLINLIVRDGKKALNSFSVYRRRSVFFLLAWPKLKRSAARSESGLNWTSRPTRRRLVCSLKICNFYFICNLSNSTIFFLFFSLAIFHDNSSLLFFNHQQNRESQRITSFRCNFEIQLWTLLDSFLLLVEERFTIEEMKNLLLIAAVAALLSFIFFSCNLELFSFHYKLLSSIYDIRFTSMRIEPVHICSQFSTWTGCSVGRLFFCVIFRKSSLVCVERERACFWVGKYFQGVKINVQMSPMEPLCWLEFQLSYLPTIRCCHHF